MKNKKANEFDDIEEYKKPPKLLIILGKLLKWLVLVCIILMLVVFSLRMCAVRIEKTDMDGPYYTGIRKRRG
mgnify:CR=1 FL=1